MDLKNTLRTRLSASPVQAAETDPELVAKVLRRLYNQSDVWYIRAGNKFRLFVITPADNGGRAEIRTVTMVFGSLEGVKWKDDSQGGWIITKGGDPVFSLESQIERYVPSLHLHELSRL